MDELFTMICRAWRSTSVREFGRGVAFSDKHTLLNSLIFKNYATRRARLRHR
jgi:hypothetical protein